jgi:RNA polymerase primary sigma factor
MEQFHEQYPAESDSFSVALDEAPEFLEADAEGAEEAASSAEESVYTDDIVRVYLREMGSVSLLTRQGEVNLARRMERGNSRVRKALSRSPLVQRMVIDLYEDLRQGKVKPGDAMEIGAADEAGRERKRAEAMQRFAKVAKRNRDLRARACARGVVSHPGPADDPVLAGNPRSAVLDGAMGGVRSRF